MKTIAIIVIIAAVAATAEPLPKGMWMASDPSAPKINRPDDPPIRVRSKHRDKKAHPEARNQFITHNRKCLMCGGKGWFHKFGGFKTQGEFPYMLVPCTEKP